MLERTFAAEGYRVEAAADGADALAAVERTVPDLLVLGRSPATAMRVPATIILIRCRLEVGAIQATAVKTPAIRNSKNATSATVTPASCEKARSFNPGTCGRA